MKRESNNEKEAKQTGPNFRTKRMSKILMTKMEERQL